MDLYAVLDHVLAFLRQRGRVSYRALKVQSHLDDEQLEALKEELLYTHQGDLEDDGRGLVWTRGVSPTPAPTSKPGQPAQVTERMEEPPAQRGSPPAAPHPPEAERRQLTVLFCDLVDSTALAMQGRGEEGLAQVRQGIAAWRATGAALWVPYFCTVLADVCAHLGHTDEGLQALAEAHNLVEQQEERYWEAEVYRLRSVLLLQQSETPLAEAETWLQRALDVARRQEAKSLELRAAMSLSRLWQQQGKRTEAHALLVPVYNWFTEGFDTADLQEARVSLDALA
jgi:hypothetical protein